VAHGLRGVWKDALTPGKYALNSYAVKVELVPTVNFVLRWITGLVETHQYDKDLKSIELITADGYEPVLPLSLVLHIDYERASSVVQRFGDVKRLISQTLDPILTAYFATWRSLRTCSTCSQSAKKFRNTRRRNSAAVSAITTSTAWPCLIGRPESRSVAPGQEDAIERLFDQLRLRRLARNRRKPLPNRRKLRRGSRS
jgi:uncharacterized membrane protein YqiK